MGQTLGRAPIPVGCNRFLNLPKSCVYDLWDSFNDIAEGFGLTIEEFQEIIKSAIMEFLSVTERQLNAETDAVFRLFDDDENKLVDSLEFISAFALLSGMTPEEKARFLFAMYDFDESGELTLDEMVLAFRSSLSGLSKLCKVDPPIESEIETIVVLGFDAARKANNNTSAALDYNGIDRESFAVFCLNSPEIMSWIEFFDDVKEYKYLLDLRYPLLPPVETHMDRVDLDLANMNATNGGFERLKYERTGKSAVKRNWHNVLPFLAPPRRAEEPTCKIAEKKVDLEWVYGFNGHSSRQCTYYSAKGLVIYAAGAVCIVQDVEKHKQEYFLCHSDLITCLKVFHTPEGETIVASGECGVRPAVHVWNCETRELLSTLQGFHRRGVAQLDFSPDRTKIATLGMDTYHCIAVYEWATRERLWSARTTRDAVHDISFLSNDILATCGEMHIMFWSETKPKRVFKRYRGQFSTASKAETLWCVGVVGTNVFAGGESGMLHVWEGRNLVNSIRSHTGAITACHVMEQGHEPGLVTGCTSGKIIVWNSKLERGATFNAASLGPIENPINSICCDTITSKILIGFKTCEIFEMDSTDGRNVHNGGSVVSAHFNPRVSGLASHPLQAQLFCTVGDDKTVRIFDAAEKKQLRVSILDSIGHCCSYSHDGQMVLVGIGNGLTGKEEKKEGAFVFLNEEDLTLVHEARDSKFLISDCKFAPNGEKFALASHDGSIYIYNTNRYQSKAQCRGHSGKVEHIDFSSSGQYLMSNCSSGDWLFWDVETGALLAPKDVKGLNWETNSCVNTYNTQGIWSECDDGTYYNMACKSNAQDVIIAVDNFGRIRLANYPCLAEETNFLQRWGHSKDTQNCQISCDDERFFTTGGTDGSIFQWKMATIDVPQLNVMKKDETLADVLSSEFRFEGKSLDRPPNYENVVNNRPDAICDLDEGLVDVTSMLPWQQTIVAPSRVPIEDLSEPADELELEFVHGFTCDTTREALMYAPNGEAAFFTASIAVVMEQKTRKQRFYTQHRATVTAMAVNHIDKVVATGDLGEAPSICVWNPENMSTIRVIQGFHRRGIIHMKFSPNGKHLASVGQDVYHSIAIYDWRNGDVIMSSTSFDNKSLFLDYNPIGNGLIHCGNEIIRFWNLESKNFHYEEAIYGSRATLQGFLCAGWIGSSAVVGTVDGHLYRFLGNKLDSIVEAHLEAVNSIAACTDGLITASSDGFLKIWSRFLECRLEIDLKHLRTISSVAKCVDCHIDSGHIIFGTSSAEIFEVGAIDGENMHQGPVLEGHGGEELWGLAVNPVKEEYCTVGDDSLLKVWDVFNHNCITTIVLEMPARCCAYAPDGKHLAIGFGCPKKLSKRQFDGKWVVLDADDFQVTHEARDSTKWMTEIKYSPNGELIAMGSTDNKIYVYSVVEGYALLAAISQHQSFIQHLDFSDDSAWLQSNCAGFELCYFEADSGLFIPAASRLRDTVWATQNCTMSWAMQGIWPPQRDGTDCCTVDCNLFRGEDGVVIALGDSYGRIRLFRYPCTSSFACSKVYWASSSQITRVRFVAGDAGLVSVCGPDKTVMQWTHKRDRDTGVAHDVLDRRGKLEEEEEDVAGFFGLSQAVALVNDDDEELNKMVSSRPWLASIVAPSNAAEYEELEILKSGLELSYILGTQSQTTRMSVRYNVSGDVVVPASKYAYVFNKKNNSQVFYFGHKNELCCLTVSKDGLLAASVEKTPRPCIHVWDANTCEVIVILPQLHRRGVSSMQFSPDRKLLVSIGQDDDYSIALWSSATGQWNDGRLLAWTKSDVNPALFCGFYEGVDGFLLASGGRFHQKFWKLTGKTINPYYPSHEKKVKIGTLLCGTVVGNKFVSGSTKGHLYVWNGRKLERMIRAHELGVSGIWACGKGVATSSKDAVIKLWSLDFEHIRTFLLADADVPPVAGSIRSLDGYMSPAQDFINRLLITTAGGEIYELSTQSGSICLLQEAHFEGEAWGLAVHPKDPDLYATAADDRTIRVWSIVGRRLLRKAVLDCSARSISWSPDGRLLIVGMGGSSDGKRQRKDGAFLLLEAETMKPLYEGRDSRHWIQDVKFSPNGKSFAVASMDHKIYIYNADNYRLKGTCDRHNSYVKQIDYSSDSMYIQSDSGDYEHLYYEAEDGEYFSAGSLLKDIKWSDWTCIFGWPVLGAWPYFEDVENGVGYEPTAVHRSPKKDLLAVGDTSGAVKLYNYPCINKQAPFMKIDGHVKEVSKVRFSCDGRYVISMGKFDRCIMVWQVVPNKTS